MKVKIYGRVSTDDKDQNPERQIMKCEQYCQLHNHEIVDIVVEHHTGDSNPFTRPKGIGLLKDDIDGIVVFSMDRFTRQHPMKVLRIMSDMKNRGIKIISITEPAFNMESEFSEMLIFILTWFNNYFLTKLKRDINSGIDRARKKGIVLGRPKIKANTYEILRLKNDGFSLRQIAKQLNLSLGKVQRCIKYVNQKEKDNLSN
jgi:DNA invertase Pin-like site-specific DNA recombinase